MTEQSYEGHEKIPENSKTFRQDCCLTYMRHQLHV